MTYDDFIQPFIELRRRALFAEIEEEQRRKDEIIYAPIKIRWRKDRYLK